MTNQQVGEFMSLGTKWPLYDTGAVPPGVWTPFRTPNSWGGMVWVKSQHGGWPAIRCVLPRETRSVRPEGF